MFGVVVVIADPVDDISSGQLPTGITSLDLSKSKTLVAKKSKRMKVSPKNKKETPQELHISFSSKMNRTLEMKFWQACLKMDVPAVSAKK